MKNTTPDLVLCELSETGLAGVDSYSPFCLKVTRALRAAGLRYVSRRSERPGTFSALNPTGQVPILLVDDQPVADSTRIVAKICELAPLAFPKSSRHEAFLWEEFADTHLNGFLVAARWADPRNWPNVRDAYFRGAPWLVRAIIAPRIRARVVRALVSRDVWRAGPDACWASFTATLDALDARAPESGFWLGDALSCGDIAIFAQLHSLRTPLTPWQASEVSARGRLVRYLDRVDAATRVGACAPAVSPKARAPHYQPELS